MALRLRHLIRVLPFAISALIALASAFSVPANSDQTSTANEVSIPSIEFDRAIGERITKVPEFAFIRKEAERLGVRAYLFGGTAAGYAHYVNWDLKREHGDSRYQANRFDYDYTNIYRSTQDLDIVIDGSAEKAQELQQSLSHSYPHLQGSKTAWEVRLLRQGIGDKQALLNNPDFINQHTDSNSTGMIEITKPPHGEPVVRDLHDWNAAEQKREPFFLKDIRDEALHYYYSPKHESTAFFREGRNPSILSVIRYLTKAFQYDLKLRGEDLAKIKTVIDRFDPTGPEMRNSYVRNWLLNKENGRKLVRNAASVEYALNTLDKLGLRHKLIAIDNNPREIDSLAWWMSKEPLRTKPLGTGHGKSAADLWNERNWPRGEKDELSVGHETSDFRAYESITQSHTGAPNVFISRDKAPGEAAAFGSGFYTRVGQEGARGTGFTIRFTVDPGAREGTDFIIAGDYVIFQNKTAIKVVPESWDLNPTDFFVRWSEGQLDESDRGILERQRRRALSKLSALSTEDVEKIKGIVSQQLSKSEPNMDLVEVWLGSFIGKQDRTAQTKVIELISKSPSPPQEYSWFKRATPFWLRAKELDPAFKDQLFNRTVELLNRDRNALHWTETAMIARQLIHHHDLPFVTQFIQNAKIPQDALADLADEYAKAYHASSQTIQSRSPSPKVLEREVLLNHMVEAVESASRGSRELPVSNLKRLLPNLSPEATREFNEFVHALQGWGNSYPPERLNEVISRETKIDPEFWDLMNEYQKRVSGWLAYDYANNSRDSRAQKAMFIGVKDPAVLDRIAALQANGERDQKFSVDLLYREDRSRLTKDPEILKRLETQIQGSLQEYAPTLKIYTKIRHDDPRLLEHLFSLGEKDPTKTGLILEALREVDQGKNPKVRDFALKVLQSAPDENVSALKGALMTLADFAEKDSKLLDPILEGSRKLIRSPYGDPPNYKSAFSRLASLDVSLGPALRSEVQNISHPIRKKRFEDALPPAVTTPATCAGLFKKWFR